MNDSSSVSKIHYTLRFACAFCFIGHGAFGVITQPLWANYMAVFGIGKPLAYHLMPLVGTMDLIFGFLILFLPLRILLSWLVVWGAITALLRPLSGEPFSEFLERAGNFGAPFALLLLSGGPGTRIREWFKPVPSRPSLDEASQGRLQNGLIMICFLLLVGHGGLNMIDKSALVNQYSTLGFPNPTATARIIGLFEVTAAFLLLLRPSRQLVMSLFLWKMFSELFYPHYELFNFLERGGSYGSLLALWFVMKPHLPSAIMQDRWFFRKFFFGDRGRDYSSSAKVSTKPLLSWRTNSVAP